MRQQELEYERGVFKQQQEIEKKEQEERKLKR